MKVGDKVLCKKAHAHFTTEGKWYEIIGLDYDWEHPHWGTAISILDNYNHYCYFNPFDENFYTEQEVRRMKIERLLTDE